MDHLETELLLNFWQVKKTQHIDTILKSSQHYANCVLLPPIKPETFLIAKHS